MVWNWKGLLMQDKHVKTFSDNTITIAVINKMGKCQNHALNKKAQQIWGFYICTTASHKTGKENVQADFESRREYKDAEGMLNPKFLMKHRRFCRFILR